MGEREETHERAVINNIEKTEAIEKAMGITYDQPIPLQTRIKHIAQGIFETTEEFFEDNPEITTQLQILYDQVFPTTDYTREPNREEISELKHQISEIRKEYNPPIFSGGGCTGSSSDNPRSRGC